MQRRDFLQTISAGLMIPFGTHAWAAVNPSSNPTTQRKLIVVMLRGAIDGLNVVAPYADKNYAQLRPSIALARPGQENGAIDLDGYFGLHPALLPLGPLWQQKKLAFVHASGSPDATRSHFDAQDYMESGTPGRKSTADGWLNRLLTLLPGDPSPIRAISIGAVMPRILSGAYPATNLAAGNAGTKSNLLDQPRIANAFDQLYKDSGKLSTAYDDAREAHKAVMTASMSPMENEMQVANGGAPLPNGFPSDAARLATLMRNDPNIQTAFFALGGWDTHINQGAASGQLANHLRPLGQGLVTLAQKLGPVFDDTLIVVMSEFGRTAKQNGNGGTDHGHGNVMWLLGGGINGGKVYGDWQGLSPQALHEQRDLPVTTDFRSVLANVAEHHLLLPDNLLVKLFPDKSLVSRNLGVIRS